MVKRAMIFCTLAVALALPAIASAELSPSDYKNTSKFCKALKADMGATLFKQTYRTHGKCVSKNVHSVDKLHKSAVTDCKAERDADQAAFNDKYGTGKNKRNALGRCVSAQAKALKADKQDAIVEAAKSCRDERNSMTAADFRAKYGTNHNGRNAFGKCVSKLVRGGATG
jgi:hypothetical protein